MCRLCNVPVEDHKGVGKNSVRAKDEQRFLSKVAVRGPDECWPWVARVSRKGYATFTWVGVIPGEERKRKFMPAHRWSYEHFVGPVEPGMTIDHQCHDPDTCEPPCLHRRCMNPAHLKPMSNRENVLRGNNMAARHARQTHCHRGHEFTADNTYTLPNGGRSCIRCRKDRTARNRERLNAMRRVRRAEAGITQNPRLSHDVPPSA